MLFKVKEFFEQFENQESVYYEETSAQFDKWIFDKELFKGQLRSELPVKDFFDWCSKQLLKDFTHVETEKFFSLCGLLFDEDLQIEFPKKDAQTVVITQNSKIVVPKIKIENIIQI
jgi:hypothetical protein